MKQFLVELDDRCAKDLEKVAPARKRLRAEFVRLAIRRAVDLALDLETARAYADAPLATATASADVEGWDPDNALALPATTDPSGGKKSVSPAVATPPRARRPARRRAA